MEYEYFYRYAKDRVLETKNNTIQRITPNKYYTLDIINNRKVDNIYLNSLLLATIDTVGVSTPTVNNILTDNLGSIQKIVDNTGNTLTSQTTYTPYGKVYQNNGTQPLRQYIGEVYDTDTNLNYLNARYYNSNDGKFISQDPVFWELGITKDGKAVLTNPQSLNSYSYANNNPITLKDPSGRVVSDYNSGLYYEGTGISFNDVNPLSVGVATFGMGREVVVGGISTLSSGLSKIFSYLKNSEKIINSSNEIKLLPQGENLFQGPAKVIFKNENVQLSEHAVTQMAKRGLTVQDVERTIQNSKVFEYLQNGKDKMLGYVDQVTKNFVAQVKDTGVVRTVIKDVTDKYISNLKSR